MAYPDFDLEALHTALDERRRARGLSWAAVAQEINRSETDDPPIKTRRHRLAASTIMGIEGRTQAEGDGVLQMLLWLGRAPESFVPGFAGSDAERFHLPEVGAGQILRWDTKALHSALNAKRQAEGMTWADVAREIGGSTPGMLTYLAKGERTGFPQVMRLIRWLDQPSVAFLRILTTPL